MSPTAASLGGVAALSYFWRRVDLRHQPAGFLLREVQSLADAAAVGCVG
jgi:hypothetical protein